jgi:hypothetical protein
MLLRHLITLMINVRSAEPNMTKKERPVFRIAPKDMFLLAKHIRRTRLRAVAGSQELGVPLAEYAASLRFQTSAPLTHKGRARTSFDARIQKPKEWWSLSGSNRRPEACKATALPAELRPLGEAKGFSLASAPAATSVALAAPRIGAGARSGWRRWRVDDPGAASGKGRPAAADVSADSQRDGRPCRRLRHPNNGGPGTTRTSDLTLIRGAL